MPTPLRRTLLTLALALATAALAQPVRVGVILSQTGPFSAEGRVAIATIDAVLAEWRTRAPGFVDGIEVELRDDAGDPLRAGRLAEELLSGGVHLLICCTSEAAVRRVAERADARSTLLLSPLGPDAAPGEWHVAFAPSEATMLRSVVRHAFAAGRNRLGLMTLATRFGADARAVLERELAVAGMELVGVATYAADQRPLTPDALWVATREPAAVVVWGLHDDSVAAVAALRVRGYEGPIYLRADLGAGGDLVGLPEGVLVALPPLSLGDGIAGDHPNADTVRQFRATIAGALGTAYLTPASARTYDLATFALRALEQVAIYGVSAGDTERFRQALRDAAIALPPLAGAAGSYDVRAGAVEASLPSGLAVGRSTPTGFVEDPLR